MAEDPDDRWRILTFENWRRLRNATSGKSVSRRWRCGCDLPCQTIHVVPPGGRITGSSFGPAWIHLLPPIDNRGFCTTCWTMCLPESLAGARWVVFDDVNYLGYTIGAELLAEVPEDKWNGSRSHFRHQPSLSDLRSHAAINSERGFTSPACPITPGRRGVFHANGAICTSRYSVTCERRLHGRLDCRRRVLSRQGIGNNSVQVNTLPRAGSQFPGGNRR